MTGEGSGSLVQYGIWVGRSDDAVRICDTRDGHYKVTHGMVALDPPPQARKRARAHETDRVAGDVPTSGRR